MRLLFDQGTPVTLRRGLAGHQVSTAFELGWASFNNGELLAHAEAAGFEATITTDKNLRYQQNLRQRRIAIFLLSTTSWLRIAGRIAQIADAVIRAQPGAYVEIEIP